MRSLLFGALLLFALLISVGNIAVPFFLSRVVDSAGMVGVMRPGDYEFNATAVQTSLYIGLLLTTNGLQVLYGYLVEKFNISIIYQLRLDAYRWMLTKRKNVRLPFSDGDAITRLQTDINSITSIVSSPLNGLIPVLLTGIIALGYLLNLSISYVLIVALACPILYLSTRWINKTTQKYSKQQRTMQGDIVNKNVNFLKNHLIYHLYGETEKEYERYKADVDEMHRIRSRGNGAFSRYWAVTNMTRAVGVAAGILIALMHISQGKYTVGNLILVSTYLGNVFAPIVQLSRYGNQLADAGIAINRIFELQPDESEVLVQRKDQRIHEIELSHVSLDFDGKKVINDVSLVLTKGKCVVLWGESGAGKSTLLQIINGILPIQSGSILVNRQDETNRMMEFISNIRFVPQIHTLFNRSLNDNIMYGSNLSECTPQLLQDAALTNLYNRLDEPVYDDMENLSGGERRRIAFARGINSYTDVYLFDEPTSELDARASMRIVDTLRELKQNSIVVVATHDAAIREIADEVIEL